MKSPLPAMEEKGKRTSRYENREGASNPPARRPEGCRENALRPEGQRVKRNPCGTKAEGE